MHSRRFRGLAASATAAAAVLAAVCGPVGAASAAVDESCRVAGKGGDVVALRYAGANRYATAICVSLSTWSPAGADEKDEFRANAVVLARGDDFPDALAGGPLAGHLGAPLLLTSPTALLPDVQAEMKRVLAPGGTVYLLGGTGSLSAGVESTARSMGYTTKRLAGANRFETAVRIAQELPKTSKFFVTTGMGFPDALAAGTFAATVNRGGAETWALVFTNNTTMPAATAAFVRQRRTELGGGELATAGGAADTAAARAFGAANLTARYVGRNRFATAAAIAAEYVVDGQLIGEGVGLADGMNFPDALAGTPTLAVYGEPLLLTQAGALPAETRAFLRSTAGRVPGMDGDPATAVIDVLGGVGAVSNPVRDAAVAAFTP
ncbi:cell wall-binding repeat-containing protein [Actinokineospora sp. NPDC004072]